MLTRRAALITLVAALLLGAGLAPSAWAGGGGSCRVNPDGTVTCETTADTPGTPGVTPVDYNPDDPDSPFIIGDTGLGTYPCPPDVTNAAAVAYCDAISRGLPPPPSPAQVAQQALSMVHLDRPSIGSAPCTDVGCQGTVGVPVWLWTQPWTAQRATATVRGVSVTVQAEITSVTWTMGDGGVVRCASPGTAYDVAMGWQDSPDCGYRYMKASRTRANPYGVYTVTATAHWRIVWTGAYRSSAEVITRSSVNIPVTEVQVVITTGRR